MVLLLSIQSRAPLPVEDSVGSVAHSLPRHLANDAGRKWSVDRAPVNEGGLRFHEPEVALFVAADEIVLGCVKNGIKLTIREVVIPCRDIEVTVQSVMIEGVVPVHGIRGDELAWLGERTNGVDLILDIRGPGVGDEMLVVEQERGVLVARMKRNLVEVVIGLRPVDSGPQVVQIGDGLVLVREPQMLLRFGELTKCRRADLVVDLPSDDVGVMAVASCHLTRDVSSKDAIAWAGARELLAVAMLGALAVFFDAQRVRIFCCKPCRRCGGRCAEDDGNMMLGG